MLHMIALDELRIPVAHREVVGGIMRQVINQVPENECREHWSYPLWCFEQNRKNEVENAIKEGSHRDADNWRHNQAGLALRLCVVDAVKEKNETFGFFTFGREVKYKTMQCVLC